MKTRMDAMLRVCAEIAVPAAVSAASRFTSPPQSGDYKTLAAHFLRAAQARHASPGMGCYSVYDAETRTLIAAADACSLSQELCKLAGKMSERIDHPLADDQVRDYFKAGVALFHQTVEKCAKTVEEAEKMAWSPEGQRVRNLRLRAKYETTRAA